MAETASAGEVKQQQAGESGVGQMQQSGPMFHGNRLDVAIAIVAHEALRAYCLQIGDNSQVNWADAPQWQKDSALKGVKLHLENEGVTPEKTHESWLEEKKLAGWKYGLVKDAEKKEHPCFVAYEKLPVEQKIKDYIFAGVVKAFKEGLAVPA